MSCCAYKRLRKKKRNAQKRIVVESVLEQNKYIFFSE